MQIQGTGKIGSTKRKFHLSGVPLIESRLYLQIEKVFKVPQGKLTLTFCYHCARGIQPVQQTIFKASICACMYICIRWFLYSVAEMPESALITLQSHIHKGGCWRTACITTVLSGGR